MVAEAAQASLTRAMLQMGANAPFFATLALFAKLEPSDAIDTAATDGERIFYNPGFVVSLSPRALLGLLLHEVLHCALEHVGRRGLREPLRWNVAADIVVNGIVRAQPWAELPASAVVDPRLEDLTVEEVYELVSPRAVLAIDQRDLREAAGELGVREVQGTDDGGVKSDQRVDFGHERRKHLVGNGSTRVDAQSEMDRVLFERLEVETAVDEAPVEVAKIVGRPHDELPEQ